MMKETFKLALLAFALSGPVLLTPPAVASTASGVMQEASVLKKTDAAGAVAKLEQYLATNPKERDVTLAKVESALAQIYAKDLKNYDKAIAVLDAGMQRSSRPDSYFLLANIKCFLLASAKKHEEARAYFHQVLPKILEHPPGSVTEQLDDLVYYYYRFVIGTVGPADEYISVFHTIFEKHPQIIWSANVTPKFVEALMAQPGKQDEALSWAKLYWMLCKFDEATVNGATALLQKAWLTKEMNTVKGTAFLTALQDTAAPNPLKDIPLPTLNIAAIKEIQRTLPETSKQSRILMHLLLGEQGDAMLIARRMLLDNPSRQGKTAALEMSRIFRATDLNLVRANAVLHYIQTGEGANPVDEFFKQQPAKSS